MYSPERTKWNVSWSLLWIEMLSTYIIKAEWSWGHWTCAHTPERHKDDDVIETYSKHRHLEELMWYSVLTLSFVTSGQVCVGITSIYICWSLGWEFLNQDRHVGHVSLIPRRYITMLTGYLDNSVYKEVVYDIVTATYLYRSVDFPNNTRYPASSVLPFQLNGPLW